MASDEVREEAVLEFLAKKVLKPGYVKYVKLLPIDSVINEMPVSAL